jgi:hypothetical protein
MRFLPCTTLCALVILSACAKKESERGAAATDTSAAAPAAAPAAPASSTSAGAAAASKLVGTWTAVGYDSGSTRASHFTVVYHQGTGGDLTGTVTFAGSGPKYNVRIVSITDSGFVQESDPHQSPTLKKDVVTHTEARFTGDSMSGTFEARPTKGGSPLHGRFTAKRTSSAPTP